MKEEEKPKTGNLYEGDKFRKIMKEHPDLPVIFLAGDNANSGDYSYMFCSSVYCEIGEILDCNQTINDEICYTDRERFEEDIFDQIEDLTGYDDRSEEWYESEAKRIASEYDPYWKKCIIVTVDN